MIVFVEHDEAGVIKSVACCAPGDAGATLRRVPSPGCNIAEVEAEVPDGRDAKSLQNIVCRYRVTGHPHKPRLTAK